MLDELPNELNQFQKIGVQAAGGGGREGSSASRSLSGLLLDETLARRPAKAPRSELWWVRAFIARAYKRRASASSILVERGLNQLSNQNQSIAREHTHASSKSDALVPTTR